VCLPAKAKDFEAERSAPSFLEAWKKRQAVETRNHEIEPGNQEGRATKE